MLKLQSYLVVTNIVLAFIVIQVSRKKMRDLQVEIDLAPSVSDYAMFLKLPE
jgi:hypothetical protein